jgi:hypothetical protein
LKQSKTFPTIDPAKIEFLTGAPTSSLATLFESADGTSAFPLEFPRQLPSLTNGTLAQSCANIQATTQA